MRCVCNISASIMCGYTVCVCVCVLYSVKICSILSGKPAGSFYDVFGVVYLQLDTNGYTNQVTACCGMQSE